MKTFIKFVVSVYITMLSINYYCIMPNFKYLQGFLISCIIVLLFGLAYVMLRNLNKK